MHVDFVHPVFDDLPECDLLEDALGDEGGEQLAVLIKTMSKGPSPMDVMLAVQNTLLRAALRERQLSQGFSTQTLALLTAASRQADRIASYTERTKVDVKLQGDSDHESALRAMMSVVKGPQR